MLAINYPCTSRSSADAFNRKTLQLTTANLLSWRQGPGAFGCIHLHGCWDNDSSLSRRYHGASSSRTAVVYKVVARIVAQGGSPHWQYIADQLIALLLWQQAPEGGFFHASGEAEPTYTSRESCPIHQMMPVLSLLSHYATLAPANPVRFEIESVLERHLSWFAAYWWKLGNGYRRPLLSPGWCGVTNQDLVAVAALARYGEVMGDWKPFQEYGQPTLETYLSPQYFHEDTGFFERGDNADFTERCSYMCLIADMLDEINRIHPDERIPGVISRVVEALAGAAYVDGQGNTQMSLGLNDAMTRREGRAVWDRSKVQLGNYPEFILFFNKFGLDCDGVPDLVAGLERTLAQYVFCDGMIPTTLDPQKPLFSMLSGSHTLIHFWEFLQIRNPGDIDISSLPGLPSVRRQCGNMTYLADRDNWLISVDGREIFHGVKRIPLGIVPVGDALANDPYREPEPAVNETLALS